MIASFADHGTADLFHGKDSKAARKVCPAALQRVAIRKLTQLHDAEALHDMAVPPGNRLEALKGDRQGQYSVRINDQYRVCFRWAVDEAQDVEIVDYHG
jgi:proteic killer suppression protein